LIGEWSLDESAQQLRDTSASGVNGTLGSTSAADAHDPQSIDGVVGRALHFAGDDWVVLPDVAALEPESITVEAWFRGDSSPGQWRYIISKGGSQCRSSSFGLYSAVNGGLGFYVLGESPDEYAVSPLAAPGVWNGKWHHAVGSYDGSRVRLYVDGVQVGSGTPWSTPIQYGIPSKGIYIGAYRGTCDLPFVGDIDQVRIWDGALTPAEIAAAAKFTQPSGVVAGGGRSGGSGAGGGGAGSGSQGGNPNGKEEPDLQLAYSVNRTSVRPGQIVLHRLQVRLKNASRTSGASGAVATLALPAGTQLVSAKSNRGPGCRGTLLVTCPLNVISGAAVGTVELAIRVLKSRTFVTTARVSAREGDLDPADNRVTAKVVARGKTLAPQIVARGKARSAMRGANRLVTATFQIDRAATVTVLLRSGAARMLALPGSKLGATLLGKSATSVSTALARAQTIRLQFVVGPASLAPGRAHTLVVTARGPDGRSTQLRLALTT
jgi:hypothetical protein